MEVTYQYHPRKNIVGKSYQSRFTDEKKLWLREYTYCRAMSGIEYIYIVIIFVLS